MEESSWYQACGEKSGMKLVLKLFWGEVELVFYISAKCEGIPSTFL